jgi:alpha-glucosidase
VLWEGATAREVFLPTGDWFDYWTGRHYAGNTTIRVPVTLDSFPLFVRGGAFIFRQPIVQNTGEMPGKPLQVLIAPANESAATLYEDDGGTLQYRHGDFLKRHFQQRRDDHEIAIEVSAPEGTYRPAARDLILEVWTDRKPQGVSVRAGTQAAALAALDPAALASSSQGWAYADGLVTVKLPDTFEAIHFAIQR